MNLFQVFSNSGKFAGNNRRLNFCPQCGASFIAKKLAKFERQKCDQCNLINHLNPVPGVNVIIRSSDEKVLIGKRAKIAQFGNAWCLPGGYIEFEESFIDAAHREVLEETGHEIQINGIVNVVSNHIDDFHHTIVVVLIGESTGGHENAGDDLIELKWIDKAMHLETVYAFEADKRIIDCYFAGGMKILPIDNRIEKFWFE